MPDSAGCRVYRHPDLPLSHYVLPALTEPWDKKEEILLEPLPNLPVIKDLIVDLGTFFANYRAVGPVFRPGDEDPEEERLMSQASVRELEEYTTCILCGACFAACPVNGKNPRYLGPAALAKLYRFRIDPRERQGASRLGVLINRMGGGPVSSIRTAAGSARKMYRRIKPSAMLDRN